MKPRPPARELLEFLVARPLLLGAVLAPIVCAVLLGASVRGVGIGMAAFAGATWGRHRIGRTASVVSGQWKITVVQVAGLAFAAGVLIFTANR